MLNKGTIVISGRTQVVHPNQPRRTGFCAQDYDGYRQESLGLKKSRLH